MHYYTKEGEPRHFEGKDGKPTTLREARKNNWLPSVTTIIGDAIRKPALEKWMVGQAILSALTLPRNVDESNEDFAKRIQADMSDESKQARDVGSEIHAQVESGEGEHAAAFQELCTELGWQVIEQEFACVGPDYAGKADLKIRDSFGQVLMVDLKGQDWEPEGKKKKPYIYDDWLYQLAAYADTDKPNTYAGLVSVVFHRKDPKLWHVHNWTLDDHARGSAIFRHLVDLWKLIKKYDPNNKETI